MNPKLIYLLEVLMGRAGPIKNFGPEYKALNPLPPLAGFFRKLHLFWCEWQVGLHFLVSIGLLTSVVSIYFYLKIIKLLMIGRNQEKTPHVRNYRRSPLRSNNSIELSMIVCVIASTIPGISMNLIIAIAQVTLF
ncbi:hypothetical protein V6Z11_D06G067600 [Gossypium hirsutum]